MATAEKFTERNAETAEELPPTSDTWAASGSSPPEAAIHTADRAEVGPLDGPAHRPPPPPEFPRGETGGQSEPYPIGLSGSQLSTEPIFQEHEEEAAPARGIEVVHTRNPDYECDIAIFINGQLLRGGAARIYDIDPGAGHLPTDWEAETEAQCSEASLGAAELVRTIRDSFWDPEYIE